MFCVDAETVNITTTQIIHKGLFASFLYRLSDNLAHIDSRDIEERDRDLAYSARPIEYAQ
jgi:hypothetical protein